MLKEISNIIRRAESILILPHIFLDGDAIGSALALGSALKADSDRKVTVCIEEPVPSVYTFLPGLEMIVQDHSDIADEFDVAIALDTGDLERLGKRVGYFTRGRITVNIDHHPTNSMFARYNAVMPERSAVGEIVYELIGLMKLPMTRETALCLYVAIAMDTGGFRFSNTTPETHMICSELLKTGIDVADISYRIFDTVSLGKVTNIGRAIDSLEMHFDGSMALMTVNTRINDAEEDFEGIVNIGRNIEGVEVAAMIRTLPGSGEIKVNLRSKEYADVAAIASAFSGGGHKRASGFTSQDDMDSLRRKLLDSVSKQLKKPGR